MVAGERDMGDASVYWPALDTVFDRVLAPFRVGTQDLGLLFSGGIDSALLGWELRDHRRFTLSTVGTAGSPDLLNAETGARLVGVPWSGSTLSDSDVLDLAREIDDETRELTPTSRSVQVAFSLAVRHAPSETLLCGQGADELFLGYAHYRGLSGSEAERRAEADLDRVRTVDWPLSQRIARRLGKTVEAPYLDPSFVEVVHDIPIATRLPAPVPKALLRNWASHRGLPALLVQRPKRALQFGSGVDRILRRAART
jgi:asparagine synthase (glutamine-hydrolysing)